MSKKHLIVNIIIAFSVICAVIAATIISSRSISIDGSNSPGYTGVKVEYSTDNIITQSGQSFDDDLWSAEFSSVKGMHGLVNVTIKFERNGLLCGDTYGTVFYVSRTGMIFDVPFSSFRGLAPMLCGVGFILLAAAVNLYFSFRRRKRCDFFTYSTPIRLGLSLFALLFSLVFAALGGYAIVEKSHPGGIEILNILYYSLSFLVFASLPFMFVYGIIMTVSNVWLVRHEGRRKTNLLAFALSLLLIGGAISIVIATLLDIRLYNMADRKVYISFARTLFSALYLYLALMFFATQYCCVLAGRRKPDYDADYIVILGCAIRPDGTPYPLLQGRADAALEFYRKQSTVTLKTPKLVPSGGRGADEIVSEAESVKNYLLKQGVFEGDIIIENKSVNTQQNMAFSKAIIEMQKEDAKVLIATTNYHSFRAGVLASSIGLKTEAVSSKTKWYFWPNAQIREFVGLMVESRKMHVLLFIIIALLSFAFSYFGPFLEKLM